MKGLGVSVYTPTTRIGGWGCTLSLLLSTSGVTCLSERGNIQSVVILQLARVTSGAPTHVLR